MEKYMVNDKKVIGNLGGENLGVTYSSGGNFKVHRGWQNDNI